jgi:hypothetical protein
LRRIEPPHIADLGGEGYGEADEIWAASTAIDVLDKNRRSAC